METIIVVGGGAAGMAAAAAAARQGHAVRIYEKNEKLGKNSLSREKAAATSPTTARRRNCFRGW